MVDFFQFDKAEDCQLHVWKIQGESRQPTLFRPRSGENRVGFESEPSLEMLG